MSVICNKEAAESEYCGGFKNCHKSIKECSKNDPECKECIEDADTEMYPLRTAAGDR